MTYRSFQITTPASAAPVSSADMKSHLRVTHADDDTLIEAYQMASQETIQRLTRRALMTQTITLKLDTFPSGAIELPRPPALTVTSIQYVDTDGATQTWDSANYDVDILSEPARITPAYNSGTLQTYPDTRTDTPNSVTIVFTAGHAAIADIPEGLRLAHKLLVGHYYENREATQFTSLFEMPLGLQMLLSAHEMPEVF